MTEIATRLSNLCLQQEEDCGIPPNANLVFQAEKKKILQGSAQPAASDRFPWLDGKGNVTWSDSRVALGKIMLARRTEYAITCVILVNMVLIIYETDEEAKCFPKYSEDPKLCPTSGANIPWLPTMNVILLVIYSLEACANIYVFRAGYFTRKMYLFDFCVCVGGWLTMVFDDMIKLGWFRVLRCGRILKAAPIVNSIPELYMLFSGFFGSMKAMFYGALVIAALLCCFSIIMVQVIHPLNVKINYEGCVRCSRSFESIAHSMLTLYQQIVAGDSWGTVSVPVVEANWFSGLLLPMSQLVIGIGAMNLILAVVVDCAVQARENNRDEVVRRKMAERKDHQLKLLKVLRDLDEDKSGSIDRAEIENAMKCSQEFRTRLDLVGIQDDEVGTVIDAITDKDQGSQGDISYMQFCNALEKIEGDDIRKVVVLIKMKLELLERRLFERLIRQDDVMLEHSHILEAICVRLGVPLPAATAAPSTTASSNFHVKPPSIWSHALAEPELVIPKRIEEHDGVETVSVCTEQIDSISRDMITSCRDKLVEQTDLLRQSLAELDQCWTRALQSAFTKSASMCEDLKCHRSSFLAHQAVENFRCLQGVSQQRKSKLLADLIDELREDTSSLVRHCERFKVLEMVDEPAGLQHIIVTMSQATAQIGIGGHSNAPERILNGISNGLSTVIDIDIPTCKQAASELPLNSARPGSVMPL